MPLLNSLSSSGAKPGMGFRAKSAVGFTGKLNSAMIKNADGLGYLKHNATALNALHTQVLKNQHIIRQGGLSTQKAKILVAKIVHEVHTKGEHLSASQHEALEKISHHLTKADNTKRIVKMGALAPHKGITSVASQQHVTSVHQIGDQISVSENEAPHASGGIASMIKHQKDLPKNIPTSGPPKPLRIKLSV